MSDWTHAMDAALRDGRVAGKSAAMIAVELGVSRNAVCGRALRLGLPKIEGDAAALLMRQGHNGLAAAARAIANRASRPKRSIPQPRLAKPPTQRERSAAEWQARNDAIAAKIPARVKAADALAIAPRPWETRKTGECTWAIGESPAILSCCNPTLDGSTWCEAHNVAGHIPSLEVKPTRWMLAA